MYSRTIYTIVFVTAWRPEGPYMGSRCLRHRQHPRDGFKTACGMDLLDPPLIRGNRARFLIRHQPIQEKYRCPDCYTVALEASRGAGGPRESLTDAEIWKCALFYHRYKWTLLELANHHNVSIGTMHKYFKERGIKRRKRVARNPEAVRIARLNLDWREAADIEYLYNSGNSMETVAQIMGMTPGRLARRMAEYGIRVRSLEEQRELARRNRPRGDHLTPEGRESLRRNGMRCFYERIGCFKDSRYDHYYEDDNERLAA